MTVMTRHERFDVAGVVPRYEIDTLGAPFKVTVLDCVTVKHDAATGKELTCVPDLVGLINAVVRARSIHPRKLNGAEIKFIRNALGLKAKLIAEFFELSPEHISRCESGDKVMSSLTERFFRLLAYAATYHSNPEELLREAMKGEEIGKEIEERVKKPDKVGKKFLEHFLAMKIEAVYDSGEELCFEFFREAMAPTNSDHPSDEPEWEPKLVCCG
jgi:transcriptional regulator with XRE-family HTH domain